MSPLLDQMSNYSTVTAHGQAWLRGQKTDPPCQSLRYRNAINKKPKKYLIRCPLCMESKEQRKEKRVSLAQDGRKEDFPSQELSQQRSLQAKRDEELEK